MITLDNFIGSWNAESSVTLTIWKEDGAFRVKAVDKYDNEDIVVSNLNIINGALVFETYVPSTKFHTKNSLKLISENKLCQELTIFETWSKEIAE